MVQIFLQTKNGVHGPPKLVGPQRPLSVWNLVGGALYLPLYKGEEDLLCHWQGGENPPKGFSSSVVGFLNVEQ